MVLWTAPRPGQFLSARGLVTMDPLAGLMAMLASRRFLVAFVPALGMLLLALLLGRVWCGWLCPLGSIIEWTSVRKNPRPMPRGLRRAKYGLLLLAAFGALLRFLGWTLLDPVTLYTRAVTTVVLPANQWLVTRLQEWLYHSELLAGAADWMDSWLRPIVLSYRQPYTRGLWAILLLIFTIIGLNRLAPRFWCRYLCPLGALLSLLSRLSLFKRRVRSSCVQCGACQRLCPMATIEAERGYASDAGECIQCLDCVDTCPAGAIAIRATCSVDRGWGYDPGRRDVLGALGITVAGASLASISASVHHPRPHLLRPPGAIESDLVATCVRCGACLRACPTHGLQRCLGEAGLVGVGTPILVPRLGHCDYSCVACGSVCPTGAIPLLALDEKRLNVIGKAYVDQQLCLPWTGRVPCIVCEEMCPLPDKAITLVNVQAQDATAEQAVLQAPVVNHSLCIGCGLCENRCPVIGEAAIRVRLDPLGQGV